MIYLEKEKKKHGGKYSAADQAQIWNFLQL